MRSFFFDGVNVDFITENILAFSFKSKINFYLAVTNFICQITNKYFKKLSEILFCKC